MPADLLLKLAADAPILLVLLLVLWKGGHKLDKFGERLDKVTMAVKNLTSRIDLLGKIQDIRLDLHEERTSHPGNGYVEVSARRSSNGAQAPAERPAQRPSWPEPSAVEVEEDA